MGLLLRRKLTIISLLLYWPAIFVFAHIPIPQLVYKARVSDKSLHFLAYLVLVFLLWFAIIPDRKVNWRKAAVWWILFAVVWYGVLDELLQKAVYMGRTCDIADFSANLTGALTGLILFTFLTFWPAFLAVTGIAVFLLTNLARENITELLPVGSAIFYLFAYGFFTLLWVQYMNLFLSLKAPQAKWLLGAVVVPAGFLVVVKLFSIIFDKPFGVRGVIISAASIAAVVIAVYGIGLFRQRSGRI
jgi:VanZ family protein